MSDKLYFDIMTASRQLLQAKDFEGLPTEETNPTEGGNIEIRKLPGPDDVLDILPLITICPAEIGERETPLGYRSKQVIYPVQFTIIWAGNKDLKNNLDIIFAWRQTIRDTFYLPDAIKALVSGANVWQTEYQANAPIDRAKVNKNYDYSALVIKFYSQEMVR